MDYKYIEQLLEHYWQCETSVQEEEILRVFFSQEDIPDALRQYQSLFLYEKIEGNQKLGEDFDKKVLDRISSPVVKARKLTLVGRFMPMLRAAAMVAFLFTLGNIAQQTFFANDNNTLDYNYAMYKDTYNDPKMAYEQISSALQKVSKGISKSHKMMIDSLHRANATDADNHTDVEE